MTRLSCFLLGLALGLPGMAGAERVGRLCQDVVLPYVVNCSTGAALRNGYTPAKCVRA